MSVPSSVMEVKQTSLVKYLKILIELDLLEREVPVTEENPEKSKKGLYFIKDNFIKFWFQFIYPNKGLLEAGREEYVFQKIKHNFIDNHVSYVYENICRDKMWTQPEFSNISFNRVGRFWGNQGVEIDIVSYDSFGKEIIFGECKYSVNPKDVDILVEEAKFTPCFVAKNKDSEQVNIAISLKAIPEESEKEAYALAVVNNVFGGSTSSRLFQNIREDKGLVYSIYSSQTLFRKCGELGIFASTSEEYLKEVYDLIIKEIKEIKENYITKEELEQSKKQLKGNYILSLESINAKMLSHGESMLLNNKIKDEDEIIEHINSVNMEQVKAIINKVFNIENLGVCIVGKDVEGVQI